MPLTIAILVVVTLTTFVCREEFFEHHLQANCSGRLVLVGVIGVVTAILLWRFAPTNTLKNGSSVLLLVSVALLMTRCVRRRAPFIPIGIGVVGNIVAVSANGGYMPLLVEFTETVRLWWLCDVVPTFCYDGAWWYASIGDLFIFFGYFYFVVQLIVLRLKRKN